MQATYRIDVRMEIGSWKGGGVHHINKTLPYTRNMYLVITNLYCICIFICHVYQYM